MCTPKGRPSPPVSGQHHQCRRGECTVPGQVGTGCRGCLPVATCPPLGGPASPPPQVPPQAHHIPFRIAQRPAVHCFGLPLQPLTTPEGPPHYGVPHLQRPRECMVGAGVRGRSGAHQAMCGSGHRTHTEEPPGSRAQGCFPAAGPQGALCCWPTRWEGPWVQALWQVQCQPGKGLPSEGGGASVSLSAQWDQMLGEDFPALAPSLGCQNQTWCMRVPPRCLF